MNKHPANEFHLLADIGGTNTRVALANGADLIGDTLAKFSNADFPDLGSVLGRFIADQGNVDCAGACVAVAGPVHNGVGQMTNLDWSVDRQLLADATGAEKVAILNDLQAQAHGLALMGSDALVTILPAKTPAPNAAKLVVGIGTGFNASVVYDLDKKILVPPSESGHIDLPVQTREDLELADFMRARHGFSAIDEVLSGRGLEAMYQWHNRQSGKQRQPNSYEIMQALAAGSDPIARKTAQHFTRLAGVAIGNLALIHLPFGGIYLAGGLARAMAPYFKELHFAKAFSDKGRFTDFMGNFGVSIIQDDAAALTGCASFLQALD